MEFGQLTMVAKVVVVLVALSFGGVAVAEQPPAKSDAAVEPSIGPGDCEYVARSIGRDHEKRAVGRKRQMI